MWTDGTTTIADNAPYVDAQGTQYPWDYPKSQIAGLTYIPPTSPDPSQVLADAKAAKNSQINLWRGSANKTYFTHAGKQVACDELSRGDIDAVANTIALTGAFPVGFPGVWKTADNSYIPMATVADFTAMYSAMALQGTMNYVRAQERKAAVKAATSIEQVSAIEW